MGYKILKQHLFIEHLKGVWFGRDKRMKEVRNLNTVKVTNHLQRAQVDRRSNINRSKSLVSQKSGIYRD